jgi:tungstate transport system ATP-binding protein
MSAENIVLMINDLKVDRGGIRVLDIPSFTLGTNEIVSLIGPNGSGKSSLLLSLICLLKRAEGNIVFKGRSIDSGKSVIEYRRKASMVFQESLLFDATVFDNVASGLKIRGFGRNEIKKRVAEYLEKFDLSHMARRHARKLSGGEAKRVSLARAFAVEPEIIFFDEPFSSLDSPTRQVLSEEMGKIIRDSGVSAVLVTHDQSEALRLSDRVLVMNKGSIVQDDIPSAVMTHPANEFVANFVGMDIILKGVVTENRNGRISVTLSENETSVVKAAGDFPIGSEVYCCIHPENVVIDLADPDDVTSARNIFEGRIRRISSSGLFLKIAIDCGFPLVSTVTMDSFSILGLEDGKKVFASFKATSVRVIQKRKQGDA